MLRRIVLSVLFLAGTCAPQASASDPAAATVLIMFGEQAKSVEHWDGSIAVAGGELTGLEGRQFSQADTVTAPDSWKCTTLQDGAPPYADAHYMEVAAVNNVQAFIDSIQTGKLLNNAEQAVESNLTAILGRNAAYRNSTITWEELLRSDQEFEANLKLRW